jgi:PKD repeat protein
MINGIEQTTKSPSDPRESVVFFQDVQFTTLASDVDEDELYYLWDFDDDGNIDEEGPGIGDKAATQVNFIYNPAYHDVGLIKVSLEVSDGTPETDNATFNFTIMLSNNRKPIPIIFAQKEGDDKPYYNSIIVHTNQKIKFFGIDSYDPDDLPGFDIDDDNKPDYDLRYKWYFDFAYDQSATTGWLNSNEVTYIYPVANSEFRYIVRLEVDDGLSMNRSGNFTVYVNVPPTPKAQIDKDKSYSPRGLLETNTEIYFIGEESYDSNNDDINFTWDFGDKSPKSYEVNPVHIYETKGLYTVKLYLSDGDFVTSAYKLPVDIKEKPLPPKAEPKFSTVQTYTLTDIWFDASWSYDPDGFHYNPKDPMSYSKDIVDYEWYFGDGNTSKEMNTTHAYAKKGVYKISLTVWDKSGITDTNMQYTIEILNRAPIANPGSNQKAKINEEKLFSGEYSNDADGYIVSYLWDFGDGSLPIWTNNSAIQHSYSEAGTFHVTLQVKDNNGGVSNASSVSVKVSGSETEETDIGDLLLLIAVIAIIIIIVAIIAAIIWIRSREAI